ncbi:unnamed protein product [Penicillium salamii]|uniref:T6SS Phospholipase effector Tle1-like catalytic domain-containing protein n=1 Tax=Penicillium salamii TaxID=1612424 RepID=A0A9W4JX20_9EURO|nr:unnamed protein product [Penicillium salamii]
MSEPKQLVLCFDGTGNTFKTDTTDTNIQKICWMLERNDEQPGIGTDITPGSLASTTIQKRSGLGNSKSLNLALGKSFDRHVLGGYRFLMRHYREGTRVYIFGFSRGAYTARFLNEMLDFVGLLGPDNEEMIPVIWDAFASWKLARSNTEKEREEKQRAYGILHFSRETLSRPLPPIHFLGLFDTVNSVAGFEVSVDAPPSTRTIRHAVSIDERRVKFRPVLLQGYQEGPRSFRYSAYKPRADEPAERSEPDGAKSTPEPPISLEAPDFEAPDFGDPNQNTDVNIDDEKQDIEELWFPGAHADVGGGFKVDPNEIWQMSHPSLVWMVQEAQKAGLRFSPHKVESSRCLKRDESQEEQSNKSVRAARMDYLHALHYSATKGLIHDLLDSVLSWRLMEYLPLRRMELQSDEKLKAVRWPPPRGQARHVPKDARIHRSAILRMQHDASYRPANLLQSLSGDENTDAFDIGKWAVHSHEGDPARESYVRQGGGR